MEKEIIKVPYNGHEIVADILPAGSVPQVFCMHGAGQSNRTGYAMLLGILAGKNISSCALDFIGHGETGGKMEDSSLRSRTKQAQAVIEQAQVLKPMNIIAGSMAGYNAIKLTEIYPVNLLVLSAPAVYDKNAYDVNFGEEFSKILRTPMSWDNTDAWEILKNYKGKIIILSGGKDTIIPPEVIQKIYDSAINASFREIIKFPEATHMMKGYLREHPEDLNMVVNKVVELMK